MTCPAVPRDDTAEAILLMFLVGWILCFLVAAWTIPAMIALLLKQLRSRPVTDEFLSGPLISVIIPARNEEQQIRQSVQSVLQSEGVRLELIAVNDRSTDATGRLMEQVAADDARMHVIHISELPPGWLGKNHAMHVAAQRAAGSLLLFTDGDVIYKPEALAMALAHVRDHQLHHLCLLPRMLPGRILENAVVAFFGLSFSIGMQLQWIRTRWPLSYAGVGAFNLVDAEFYRGFGGHQPIALDVLDDVKLGKLVKRYGGRQDFQSAPELLSIRWQPSLWGVITGLEKNGFAALNYSIGGICLVTIVFLTGMILPYAAAAFLPGAAGSGFLATVVVWHVVYGAACVLSGAGFAVTALFPLAACIMVFAFWRSAVITLKQGGIRWRDSFYPLSLLRPAVYR